MSLGPLKTHQAGAAGAFVYFPRKKTHGPKLAQHLRGGETKRGVLNRFN